MSLTGRQREVVRLLCDGLQTKQIARQLGITPAVVSNHLLAVRQRNGLKNVCQIGMAAERAGIMKVREPASSVAYPTDRRPGSETSPTRIEKTPVEAVPTGALEANNAN